MASSRLPIGRKIPFLSLIIFVQYPPFFWMQETLRQILQVILAGILCRVIDILLLCFRVRTPGLGPQNWFTECAPVPQKWFTEWLFSKISSV